MIKTLGLAVCVLLALNAGCLGPEERRQETIPINPKLKRITDWPAAHDPVWVTPSSLFLYGGKLVGAHIISGIYEVTVDSTTFALQSYVPYNFPYHIWTTSYDFALQKIIIIYVDEYVDDGRLLNGFRVAYVSLTNTQVVVDEEFVAPNASPWGVSPWPGRPGVVFYGTDPVNEVGGFYWRRPLQADSLLHAVDLDARSARGMGIDPAGCWLFFSKQTGRVATFFKFDLSQVQPEPVVFAQRTGYDGAIVPNPADPKFVLLNYYFPGAGSNPPQSHIELFDLATSESVDLNVRTSPYLAYFTLNDHPWWSHDGRHFAFAAGSFSGEGAQAPWELWIYPDVP